MRRFIIRVAIGCGLLVAVLAFAALDARALDIGGIAGGASQSCRFYRVDGNAGYIAVQTEPTGNMPFGVYLYDKTAEAGPWVVTAQVVGVKGSRQVINKAYAPHSVMNRKFSKPGHLFTVKAVHTDLKGVKYFSLPFVCVIPPRGA